MRKVIIDQDMNRAWETWTVTIPDDAPRDEKELLEWLNDYDNSMLFDYEEMIDSGGEVEILEVRDIHDE